MKTEVIIAISVTESDVDLITDSKSEFIGDSVSYGLLNMPNRNTVKNIDHYVEHLLNASSLHCYSLQ